MIMKYMFSVFGLPLPIKSCCLNNRDKIRKVSNKYGRRAFARVDKENPKWQIPRHKGKFEANSSTGMKNSQICLNWGKKARVF